MHLYKTYNDLLKIESGLQEQINMTKHELYIHHGLDLDNEDFIGFIGGGQVSYEFGMNTAVKQLDSRITYLNKVYAELHEVETKKGRLTKHMSRLESLEHRILYMRLIEGKEVKEIAKEVGYSKAMVYRKWDELRKSKVGWIITQLERGYYS